MPVWDLNKAKKMKGDPQKNIQTILKKYGVREKNPFEDIFYLGKLVAKYNDKTQEHIVFGKQKREFKYFEFISPETEFVVGMIDPVTRKYNKSYAYIGSLSKGKYSGSFHIELVEKMCKIFGVKRIYLHDASSVKCKDNRIDLKFLKLIQEGVSWYQKIGYKLDFDISTGRMNLSTKKRAKQIYADCVKKLRKIPIKSVYKDYANINELTARIIKEEDYKNVVGIEPELFTNNNIGRYPDVDYSNVMKEIVLEISHIGIEIIKLLDTSFTDDPETKDMTLSQFLSFIYEKDCELYHKLFKLLFDNQIYHWEYSGKSLGLTYKNTTKKVRFMKFLHCLRQAFTGTMVYKDL